MNKKYLSALLFGAVLIASTGTFTSCKDYDDDIQALQSTVNSQQSALDALTKQVSTLENAAEAAQTTADEAKEAAQKAAEEAAKAQATGDEALAQAKAAEANAQAALAAAEEAKAEALKAVDEKIQQLREEINEGIVTDINDLNNRLAEIAGLIEGVQGDLNELGIEVAENAAEIDDVWQAIATLNAAHEQYELQLSTLENYKNTLEKETIPGLNKSIEILGKDIEELKSKISDVEGTLAQEVETINATIEQAKDELNEAINSTKDELNKTIEKVKTDLTDEISRIDKEIDSIQSDIIKINAGLNQLHILVAARLSSISFAPDNFVDGVEAVVFNSLVYADWTKLEETKESLADEKKLSTAALATASYHFNPSTFNLDNATYQFIDREANLISRAGATATDLFTVEEGPVANIEDGTVDFKLRRTNVPTTQPEEKDINIVALQATLDESILSEAEKGSNVVITSPYVEVYDATITQEDLFISDKETLKKDGATAHYALTAQDAQNEEPRYEVIYDKEFDLASLVATCLFDDEANTHNAFDTDAYKLSYRFAVAETAYNIPSDATITNQQTVIECTDAEKGLYKVSDKILREAIGRTPILRVELVDESGRVVRRGFVKVEVIAEKSADMTQAKSFDLVYGCASDVFTFELDEEWMRENVYRTITSSRDDVSLSHEEFWNMYEVSGVTMEKNGKAFSGTTLGVVNGDPATGTATKKVVWSGTHGDLGEIGQTGSVFVGTVVLTNKIQASEYPAKVSLVMTINVTLPAVSGEFVKNEVYWSGDAFISNVNYPESETDIADNCLFETKLGDAFSSIKLSELPKCIATYYKVAKVYSGNTDLTSENGVYINGDSADDQVISLDKTNDKIKAALNSQDGLSAIVEYVVKFESGDVVKVTEFVVNFVRPVNLNMPAGLSVIDAKTGGDIVDFGGAQLLTDWRNYAITEPGTEDVLARGGVWRHNPAAHETTVIPGWYEVKQAAQWNIVLKDVVIDNPVDVYGGTVDVRITWFNAENQYTEQRSFTVETIYDSKATVATILDSKITAYIGDNTPDGYYYGGYVMGNINYTQTKTATTIKAIESIEYIPAEVVYHEPQVVVEECTFVAPNRLGEYDGEIVGCWQWIDQSQIVTNTVPGAYWNFYGPFGELTLDVTKATTNLDYNGGKLPSNVTLTQVGNTVKYENIGTPVNYSYNIYIPASISYGWGTANATLTITVNPATTK